MKHLTRVAFAASLAIWAMQANAGIVLTTAGGTSVGIQDRGALGEAGVGITFAGVGDGITPGCLCEGWGASGNGAVGYSGNANGGNVNITLVSFAAGVSTVAVGGGPLVTQAYTLSASPFLVRNSVTLTNTSGAVMTDVRYTRSMDWDIPPTPFSEVVTLQGVGATRLLFSNDNGFGTPNPLVNPSEIVAGTTNVNFVDSGPSDHGSYFTFGFGNLAIGAVATFDIFYGAAPSEAAALAALGTVGAEVFSLGQNNRTAMTDGTPATFIFGFAGVGGTALPPPDGTPGGTIPEPSGFALALTALGIAGTAARKKRNQTGRG